MSVHSKVGSDVATGDVLCHSTGTCPLLIAGWRPYDHPTAGAGRIAVDGLGNGMVVFDDWPVYVLAGDGAA